MVPQSRGQIPKALLQITTPLRGKVWEQELAEHPDRQLANYVTHGIFHGFRVGFDHSKPLRSRPGNMKSALEHPDVVSTYLEQERALNRMAVVHPEDMPHIHCHISPFGVIPKKSKPGHWRLIVDLSSPENASVNNGINKDNYVQHFVHYHGLGNRPHSKPRERHLDGEGRHQASVQDRASSPR